MSIALSDLPQRGQGDERCSSLKGSGGKHALYDFLGMSGVQQIVEQQARTIQERSAVVCGNRRLTYGELNGHANQLAHALRRLGVGPDVLVGICLERSIEMVVGVLGILKAGGAYVPLDPAYPAERLAFLLEDAHAPLVLTRRRLGEQLPASPEHLFLIDADPQQLTRESVENPSGPLAATNLAYVIYTSGSTGKPKGVSMPHRPLLNLIAWQVEAMEQGGRILQFAPLSFDVSFQELFAAWGSAGTLVLLSEEQRRDVFQLWRLIGDERITHLFLPQVALQQLAEAASSLEQVPGSVQAVITAGEQVICSPAIRSLFQRLNCGLHNQYGPTESHVVTAHTLSGPPADWPTFPPIGKPIVNTHIYLLDEHERPVETGEAGEIYIGGICLARGYHHRPELTAERFVPHPFSAEPGARLYRTGDLGRAQPDGTLEFLGRLDQQVKIRGYRVELGEVEAVLAEHPSIRQGVVVVQDQGAHRELVAYLLLRANLSASKIRHFLQERVPAYMIPSVFIAVENFPQTAIGKLDRLSLSQNGPREHLLETDAVFAAPRTSWEELLLTVWSDILKRERGSISMRDSFADLGGDSLQATRILARLRQILQRDIPVSLIVEGETIEQCACMLERWSASEEGSKQAR